MSTDLHILEEAELFISKIILELVIESGERVKKIRLRTRYVECTYTAALSVHSLKYSKLQIIKHKDSGPTDSILLSSHILYIP